MADANSFCTAVLFYSIVTADIRTSMVDLLYNRSITTNRFPQWESRQDGGVALGMTCFMAISQ